MVVPGIREQDLRQRPDTTGEHDQNLIGVLKSYDMYEEHFSVQLVEGIFIDEGTVAITDYCDLFPFRGPPA